MKLNKKIISILAGVMAVICLCSCSTNSNRSIDRAVRRGENAIDRGIGSIGNGIDNATDIITGDNYNANGGMTYGANSGYSGYAGIGTSTMPRSGGADLMPNHNRSNLGQVNTTNGSADGGHR